MLNRLPIPLLIAALGAVRAAARCCWRSASRMTSATEVVIFALACMALNILVGHTGLVSFGHGAWFGLAAYAAALDPAQLVAGLVLRCRSLLGVWSSSLVASALRLPDPAPARRLLLAADAGAGGDALRGRVPLDRRHRRRERPRRHHAADAARRSISRSRPTYYVRASPRSASRCCILLWRFHRSPVGTRAGRDPRERAARALPRLSDQPLQARSAFVLSAAITGLAGVLLLFNNRMTSAEPISVAFSGELLAMVVIGGMRSFLGPALGALFFILFREFSRHLTPRTGCSGSACCSSASSCSRRPAWSASPSG